MTSSEPAVAPSYARIARVWWPLAASWLLMAAELPALSAVVARLDQPVISLAAYGGVVFPLALLIESPIIMLLAASTTLCKDWASYVTVRRFMMIAGAALTGLHILVVFTPLYYFVVEGILGSPAPIVEPARIGLMIMTPWTWAIAYRRFHQGVLIRFGHSRVVGAGSVVRLATDGAVLAVGYLMGTVPGIVVATAAVASGVLAEAAFVGIRVRPVLLYELRPAPPVEPRLTYPSFFRFYVPLVLTALLSLVAYPIGSAAMSRMPAALASLAVWPVVSGLMFMLRSFGVALNEVVVTFLDEPGSAPQLRRFAGGLAVGSSALMCLIALTPLSLFWFGGVSGLSTALALMARTALWVALPLPALSVAQSWFQGAILFSRRTRGITEAVVAYLISLSAILVLGAASAAVAGIYVGIVALTSASLVQTAWLWRRSSPALAAVLERDADGGRQPGVASSA